MVSSFISPLVERFGNISIGKKIFVASNTTLRADPSTRICLGNATNLQDNIVLLALSNQKAPATVSDFSSRIEHPHRRHRLDNTKRENVTPQIGRTADLTCT